MTPNQSAYRAVQARRSLPHGQRPTDLHIRVAFLLARWQHPSPCHARLARAAHCHRNSVLNALHRLRDLGLLIPGAAASTARCTGGGCRGPNVYDCSWAILLLPPVRSRPVGKGRKLSAFTWPTKLVHRRSAAVAGAHGGRSNSRALGVG